jgi:hypothetical protein
VACYVCLPVLDVSQQYSALAGREDDYMAAMDLPPTSSESESEDEEAESISQNPLAEYRCAVKHTEHVSPDSLPYLTIYIVLLSTC